MITLKNGPSGASIEPKHLGLFVECKKSRHGKSDSEFPDFGRLSLSHFFDG